jgi:hypothetical protein
MILPAFLLAARRQGKTTRLHPDRDRLSCLKSCLSQPLARDIYLRRAAVTAFWAISHNAALFRFGNLPFWLAIVSSHDNYLV